MKILALECSAGPASCAIIEDGRLLASAAVHVATTHSQTLMPLIEKCLADTGNKVSDMDAIAVSNGPGSFTGIRIGVATVKGLAAGHDTPTVGVSTLAAMSRNFDGVPITAELCCVMDARCRQVYTARFSCDNGKITRLSPDEAITIDELYENLKYSKNLIIMVGDGADLCYNALRERLPQLRPAPPHLRYQSAVGVAFEAQDIAREGKALPPDKLLPFYLRLPQAERELKKKQELSL